MLTSDVGRNGLSLLYLAIPLGSLVAIRAQAGPEVLLLAPRHGDGQRYVAILRRTYAVGTRPLAPAISPKKTVEGAVCGFVAGITVVMAIVGRWWLPGVDLGVYDWRWGRVVAGLGIAGRSVRVERSNGGRQLKDASSLIPGHGGVLDRLDGYLVCGAGLLRWSSC